MEIKSEMDIADAAEAFKLTLKALYKFYGEPLEQTDENAKNSVLKDPRDSGLSMAEFIKTGISFYLEDIGISEEDNLYSEIYPKVISGLCAGLQDEDE
jgi:hypothetical protein